MSSQTKVNFFASIIFAVCCLFAFATPAQAQVAYPSNSVNNPASCPAFNRNWQCTSIGLLATPFTTCVQTVRGGVIVDQRNRTFSGEAGFNEFLASAPAGTTYQQCGATPACTQTTETRSLSCPSGQTGSVTQTRTLNTGGVCGATSAWTETANTCTAIPSCTQTTETRTLACPAGQTGLITQTRTLNTGNVCGATSAYVETSNTCIVPPATVCVNPFGGTLQVGQSITAYQTITVAYGQICVSQVRVCQANGTLSGSYTAQTCSVTPPATCMLPWGGTIADGDSVTAYRHVTITKAATTNTSATVINSLCAIARTTHLYVTAGTCTDIPSGTTNPTGNGATTTTSEFCLSETRTCHNGVLSGSYTEQTCSATPSCTQTTETRTNGQTCPAGQTGTITETRTVNTGGVCGSYGAWTVTSNTCTTPTPQNCTLPWGGTLANGQSVVAYLESSVANGGTCYYETRVCNNGVLSGSYTKQSCVIQQPQTCTLPWGGTLANGQSVTAYQTATTPYGSTCTSQTRTCTNGVLSGSYTFQTCSMGQPQTCTLPGGGTILSGQSVTYYQSANPAEGTACVSQMRSCTNGTLSGSYTSTSCTQVICTTADAGDAHAKACTTTGYNNGTSTGSSTTTVGATQEQATSLQQTQAQQNETASQSESQAASAAQQQSANINTQNNGNGTIDVGVEQAQAQATNQSQYQYSSSPGGVLSQGQNQGISQSQAQEIWDRINGALSRILNTSTSQSATTGG